MRMMMMRGRRMMMRWEWCVVTCYSAHQAPVIATYYFHKCCHCFQQQQRQEEPEKQEKQEKQEEQFQ